jgi:hypothetical protein
MLYVLIGLVVVLALVSGFEYATIRMVKAERRAELAELKNGNLILADKCRMLAKKNDELSERLAFMENMGEALNND